MWRAGYAPDQTEGLGRGGPDRTKGRGNDVVSYSVGLSQGSPSATRPKVVA